MSAVESHLMIFNIIGEDATFSADVYKDRLHLRAVAPRGVGVLDAQLSASAVRDLAAVLAAFVEETVDCANCQAGLFRTDALTGPSPYAEDKDETYCDHECMDAHAERVQS